MCHTTWGTSKCTQCLKCVQKNAKHVPIGAKEKCRRSLQMTICSASKRWMLVLGQFVCARMGKKHLWMGEFFDLSVTSFWPLYFWPLLKYRRTCWAWKKNCLKKGDPERLQRTLGTAGSLAASLEAFFCRCSALTLKTWVEKKGICLVMKESRGGGSDFQSFNRSETPRRILKFVFGEGE